MKRSAMPPSTKPLKRSSIGTSKKFTQSCRNPLSAVSVLSVAKLPVASKTSMLRTANLGQSAIKPPAKISLSAKPRMRKCAICKTPFRPVNVMRDKWCSVECGTELGIRLAAIRKAKAARAERANDRKKKEAMYGRKWHIATTKHAMHAYVRARDEGKTCISCDTLLIKMGRVGGDYDAGHFRSVGSAKHLEFEETNVHGQCKHCNDALGGNPHGYEIGLTNRFGAEYVERIKADNESRKLTIDDLIALTALYRAKFKALKN